MFQGNLDGLECFLISRTGDPGEVYRARVWARAGHRCQTEDGEAAAAQRFLDPEDPELPTPRVCAGTRDSACYEQGTLL